MNSRAKEILKRENGKMTTTKRTLEFANQSIREIREDIKLLGANAPGRLIVNHENGRIIDYMPLAYDQGKVTCIDEDSLEMPLFNILWNYIVAIKAEQFGRAPNKRSVWVITARLVLDLTQKEFAELLGVSEPAVQSWELEVRFPRVDKLFRLARKYSFPIEGLDLD